MKITNTISLLLLLLLFSCGESNNSTDKTSMKLNYQIIPEDYDTNLYYVSWVDTLGKKEGYLPNNLIKRPYEVWCVITDRSNDTLGYYKGLSTAQTLAYFQSPDSIVTLNFFIGSNLFSDKVENIKTVPDDRGENNPLTAFEPVVINLKSDLRKEFKIVLKEK